MSRRLAMALEDADIDLRVAELREEFFPRPIQGTLSTAMDVGTALRAAAVADVEVAELERRLDVARARAKRASDRLQKLADQLAGKPATVHVMPS